MVCWCGYDVQYRLPSLRHQRSSWMDMARFVSNKYIKHACTDLHQYFFASRLRSMVITRYLLVDKDKCSGQTFFYSSNYLWTRPDREPVLQIISLAHLGYRIYCKDLFPKHRE